jgi:hypothetical protein
MILRFNIPDDQVNTVIEAICFVYQYPEFVRNPETGSIDVPNPETKSQFARRQVVEFMQNAVKEYRRSYYQESMTSSINADVAAANITAL